MPTLPSLDQSLEINYLRDPVTTLNKGIYKIDRSIIRNLASYLENSLYRSIRKSFLYKDEILWEFPSWNKQSTRVVRKCLLSCIDLRTVQFLLFKSDRRHLVNLNPIYSLIYFRYLASLSMLPLTSSSASTGFYSLFAKFYLFYFFVFEMISIDTFNQNAKEQLIKK